MSWEKGHIITSLTFRSEVKGLWTNWKNRISNLEDLASTETWKHSEYQVLQMDKNCVISWWFNVFEKYQFSTILTLSDMAHALFFSRSEQPLLNHLSTGGNSMSQTDGCFAWSLSLIQNFMRSPLTYDWEQRHYTLQLILEVVESKRKLLIWILSELELYYPTVIS